MQEMTKNKLGQKKKKKKKRFSIFFPILFYRASLARKGTNKWFRNSRLVMNTNEIILFFSFFATTQKEMIREHNNNSRLDIMRVSIK